ncbi:hypothetical protein SAMN04487981_10417 [Streptomyces sp. cf386]|uniref:hypothetical protein n=1 Tax=Streptomyces sp. cf386 TaxID=1761904 RepID=UPI0008898CA8|nr:hypothetical protein [Streptomyces sp. cf386]SDN19271.1 hypothetical protein SAMN04487981_10417 [Streptomyces sp. cf386]
MKDPVFVIHGVANRDRDEFATAVSALATASGVDMVPVHWGDLGAQDQFIDAALPAYRTGPEILRDSEAPEHVVGAPLSTPVFTEAVDQNQQLSQVEASLRTHLVEWDDGEDDGLRDRSRHRLDPDQILEYVAELWPDTEWLSRTSDAQLLGETGRALAHALLDEADSDSEDSYYGLRGQGADGDSRLRSLVRRRLKDLDRVAGAAVQAVGARLNHAVRSRFGPGTTRFLGDVLVYQRHQAAVHARVREVIDDVHPDLGRSPDRPVRVAAHSLGGVIAVDMATATVPLWTESLVTFGSQAAFFHVCDPRGGQLSPYAGHTPVHLPASLNRWTNLWEPLDVLAFAASKVFRLHDGTAPVDLPVGHQASTGMWTHSVYWDLPYVASVIGDVMRQDQPF